MIVEEAPALEVVELPELEASPVCEWEHTYMKVVKILGFTVGGVGEMNGTDPCGVIATWRGSACTASRLLCEEGKLEIEKMCAAGKVLCPVCGTDCTTFVPI